jgi:hypothetical protein
MTCIKRDNVPACLPRIACTGILLLLFQVVYAHPAVTVIDGIAGPEDIVVDSYSTPPRLLVSSTDRRFGERPGAIYEVVPGSGAIRVLERTGEPSGLIFNPHGIDIVENENGEVILYVIIHWEEGDNEKHAVIRYQVLPDALSFERLYTDELLVSPNDLSALDDGTIYVSNDSSGKGGMFETIIGLKRSTLVYFDGERWSVAADRIAMANGIAAFQDCVDLAATRENRVYRFGSERSGRLVEKETAARIKGPDNISVWNGSLIVAGHRKSLALARHLSASKNPPESPTTLYQIDMETDEVHTLFSDGGDIISAGSVGVHYDGNIYIGQIMDPFIISVPVE